MARSKVGKQMARMMVSPGEKALNIARSRHGFTDAGGTRYPGHGKEKPPKRPPMKKKGSGWKKWREKHGRGK